MTFTNISVVLLSNRFVRKVCQTNVDRVNTLPTINLLIGEVLEGTLVSETFGCGDINRFPLTCMNHLLLVNKYGVSTGPTTR